MTRYPTSIRRRLLLFMLWVLLIVVVATALITYRVGLRVATHAYDRSLLDPALALAQSVRVREDGAHLELSSDGQRALLFDESDTLVFQVRDNTGQLIAGEPDLPLPAADISDTRGYFYDAIWRGKHLRIAALRSGTGMVVQVGETRNKRTRLVWQVLIAALVPTILVALTALILVRTSVARALTPLDHIRADLVHRSATDLGPLDAGSAPDEVRPAVLALNHLFERLRETNAVQDRFLANAAHQLRTPLAGLQMQLELLMRLPHTPEVRAELEKMHAATRRTSRLANQLLALARADRTADQVRQREVVDLYRIGDLAARDWTARAIERDIDLGFDLQHTVVNGDDLLLRELLANLEGPKSVTLLHATLATREEHRLR